MLNHRTLLGFEPAMLRQLGYEVYVPKRFPSVGFRSAALTYEFDATLTIPSSVLKRLNRFDFYQDEWPRWVVEAVNEYFGIMFVIPVARGITSAIDNFSGVVALRAFGLSEELRYAELLETVCGPGIRERIMARGRGFAFVPGYAELPEVEEGFLADNSVFLPIGCPDPFYQHDGTHRRESNDVLFLCSNRVSDVHYARQFKNFLGVVGDLPHVVVDGEDPAGDDPHIRHRLPYDELLGLYRGSAVYYTPAKEPRHTLYSPIEAAIVGLPVVFHAESLLARLLPEGVPGIVASDEEARGLVSRIVAGDAELERELFEGQRAIGQAFSTRFQRPQWAAGMAALADRLAELGDGVPVAELRERADTIRRAATGLGDVLDLPFVWSAAEKPPRELSQVTGWGDAEPFGRWSVGDRAELRFCVDLPPYALVTVEALPFGRNLRARFHLTIGRDRVAFRLPAPGVQTVRLPIKVTRPTRRLVFDIPHPETPGVDRRLLGLGLCSIAIDPFPDRESLEKALTGSPITEQVTVDLTTEPPAHIATMVGLSFRESFGRWTDGRRVELTFDGVLPPIHILRMKLRPYGATRGRRIPIAVGAHRTSIALHSGEEQEISLGVWNERPTRTIAFRVTAPQSAPGDNRRLGFSVREVSVIPVRSRADLLADERIAASRQTTRSARVRRLASTLRRLQRVVLSRLPQKQRR